MTKEPPATSSNRLLRAVAIAAVAGFMLFAVLWYAVFSAVTAALLAAAGTGVVVVGASTSDLIDGLLEMLSNAVLALLGVIAAILAAILAIFD